MQNAVVYEESNVRPVAYMQNFESWQVESWQVTQCFGWGVKGAER